jgi:ATP/maltotriose-dependent transcriptional regulator MalT
MLDSLYAIWCELGNLLGVLLAGALLVAVQEIRKRVQKQMETADKKLDAVTTTINEVAKTTNGRLDEALAAVAAAREDAQAYRLLAERWASIIKALNATPEGRTALDTVMQHQRLSIHDSAFDEMLSRLLHIPPPPPGGRYD